MKAIEFFKNAFADMKESAKEQRKIDKANFEAIKAESKANFEENRGKNTLKRGKEGRLNIKNKQKEERELKLKEATERKEKAIDRYLNAKGV